MENPEKHGFLVKFEGKTGGETGSPPDSSSSGVDTAPALASAASSGEADPLLRAMTQDPAASLVEITDEFGRVQVVKKRSHEHLEYERRQREGDEWHRKRLRGDDEVGAQQWPVSSGTDRRECGEWMGDQDHMGTAIEPFHYFQLPHQRLMGYRSRDEGL